MAWFITFTCYGTHFHEPPRLAAWEQRRLRQAPYALCPQLASIQDTCRHRGWRLLAAHVRTTHVHLVVQSEQPPEFVMSVVKTNASDALNSAGLDPTARRRWTRHGSTRPASDVERVIAYVADGQGEPMEVYVKEDR